MKIKEIFLQDRPREKLMTYGASLLSEEELLAILINSGTAKCSAIELGKQVIEKANGIRGLADITLEQLMSIKGIGAGKATKIYAALELSKRISKMKAAERYHIDSPETVADIFMEELRYQKKEVVKLLLLDTKGGIVGDVQLSEGSLNSSIVHPREVFREAVIRCANTLVLVHNHPSGDPTPSEQDILLTRRMVDAGKIMGIELIDHIIIGDGTYSSIKKLGYI